MAVRRHENDGNAAQALGETRGALIGGEAAELPGEAEFRLVPCALDLLATRGDGR